MPARGAGVRGDRVRPRVARPARRRGGPGPRRTGRARGHAAAARPGPGRGAPRAARLAQPLVAPPGLRAVRPQRPGEHRRRRRAAAPPCCGSRAPTKALVATTDGNAPGRRAGPVAGRRAVRRRGRRATCRSPAPGRWASRTASTTATRRAPRRSGRWPRASAGLADACVALGLPVTGGNVSLYNEAPGSAIAPTPEIGIVGLLDGRRDARGAGVPRRRQRGAARRRRPAPGLAGSEYARLAGAAARGRPAAAGPRARAAASRPSSARPSPAASSRAARTCPAAGSRWPLAEMCIWGDRGAQLRLGVGRLAGGRAVRREPVAPRRARSRPRHAPAFELLARQHGLPVRRAGHHRRRRDSSIELARRGRHRGRRGARQPDRRRARGRVADLRHAWEHGLPRALGWEGAGADDRRREPRSRVPRSPADVRRRRGRAAQPRPRGRGRRRDGAVRAPAPGPGVGGRRRLRRGAPDDLQGPGHGRPGPRRAADPVARGRPRGRALPVLDHRLHGLGERPAHAAPRARAGRSPSATTGTSSTPASCSTSSQGGRGRLPASTDTELLTALLADEPADDTVDALRQGPAAGPRRVQPRRARRAARHRRPRPARVPAARPRPAPAPRRRGHARACGATTRRAGSSPRRPPRSTSWAPSSCATWSPARSWSWSPAASRVSVRYAEATPALCVFELIYFARPDSYMEGRNLYEARRQMGMQLAEEHPVEADLVMPVPDTGAPGRRRVRRGVGHPVPRGHGPQPLQRPDVHPAVAGDAPARRQRQALARSARSSATSA